MQYVLRACIFCLLKLPTYSRNLSFLLLPGLSLTRHYMFILVYGIMRDVGHWHVLSKDTLQHGMVHNVPHRTAPILA